MLWKKIVALARTYIALGVAKTYRNIFEDLVDDQHRCTDQQDRFPFRPVEGGDGEQSLHCHMHLAPHLITATE